MKINLMIIKIAVSIWSKQLFDRKCTHFDVFVKQILIFSYSAVRLTIEQPCSHLQGMYFKSDCPLLSALLHSIAFTFSIVIPKDYDFYCLSLYWNETTLVHFMILISFVSFRAYFFATFNLAYCIALAVFSIALPVHCVRVIVTTL